MALADGWLAAGLPLDQHCVAFGRYLRRCGVDVAPSQLLAWLHCLPHTDLTSRAEFRNTARAALVSHREELARFDLAFDRFWGAASPLIPAARRAGQEVVAAEPVWALDEAGLPPDAPHFSPDPTLAFSAAEHLRRRDFGGLSADELATVLRLARTLAWQAPLRRSRRLTPAPHGRRHDWRRSLRNSLRHDGDLLHLAWRTRRVRPRPLVLLCDVSGSMARYSRILLQFLYVVARRHQRVEAFVFSTRLTRITHHLTRTDAAAALDAAVTAASDWGGGTRIGAALRTFDVTWARRVLGRGAVVLILSDGCDRGDVALLAQEMARLQRSCHRLLWLNPWLGQAGYSPAVRGMQAALPHVDSFLPVHNLASLEQLAATLRSIS